jgi:multiple sugar transport system permease protein
MINSLIVSIGVTVITLVISTLAAYGFSRASFRGQKILLGIVVVSIMVPGQIFVVPLFDQMLSWGLVDTYGGVILPQVINPVMVFVLKRFFDEIPRELEDAARVDGTNRLRVFTAVVLPLSKGIIAAVAIFVFIGAWNNFLWPFIVTNNPLLMTLPVGLQTVKAGTGYGVQFAQDMAGAVLAAAPAPIAATTVRVAPTSFSRSTVARSTGCLGHPAEPPQGKRDSLCFDFIRSCSYVG